MKNEFMINDYVAIVNSVLINFKNDSLNKLIKIFEDYYRNNNKIFVFGNGGSAATASHFCEDLGKGTLNDLASKRLKVISLSENIPYLTAWANDRNYREIFLQQLINLAEPEDLVIGISVSGNSENVLEVIRFANLHKMITAGFTGFDGGTLGKIVQYHINIPSSNFGIVESLHLLLMHYIVESLKNVNY